MKKKTIFLTGGSGEIGGAIADKFKKENYQVISPNRQELDLADEDHIQNFLSGFSEKIDSFVHCAGFNEPKKIADIASTDVQKTIHINSISFYQLAHHFIKNQLLNENASILGVSSIYGFLARPGRFSYSASKFCLNGMVKTLALELGSLNIKANIIAPGFVDTKMTRKNNSQQVIDGFKRKIPLGRLAAPEDIAETAFYLCSEQNRYITGQEIVVDGGYSIGGFEL